jgi:hypothetical protein
VVRSQERKKTNNLNRKKSIFNFQSIFSLKFHFQITSILSPTPVTLLQLAQKLFKYNGGFQHARLLVVLNARLFFDTVIVLGRLHVEGIDLVKKLTGVENKQKTIESQ